MTVLAMVMKFCGWIDPIKGGALHMNRNSCLLNFLVIAHCLFSYMILVTTWGKKGVSCDNLPLLFFIVYKTSWKRENVGYQISLEKEKMLITQILDWAKLNAFVDDKLFFL